MAVLPRVSTAVLLLVSMVALLLVSTAVNMAVLPAPMDSPLPRTKVVATAVIRDNSIGTSLEASMACMEVSGAVFHERGYPGAQAGTQRRSVRERAATGA